MAIGREQRGSLIAFACACVAHVALVVWMSYARPPADASSLALAPRRAEAAPLIAVPPPEPPPRSTAIGEASGAGESISRVDLPNVQQSRQPREIEQAWTRQRPTLTPPPQDAATPPASPIGPAAPTKLAAPRPKPRETSPVGTVVAAKVEPPREPEDLKKPDAPLELERPAQPDSPVEAAQPAAKSTPKPPDPADAGPSDLDPFAKAEGVDFKPRGLEARTGRPVKLVRPRIDLAYMADATAMRGRKTTILLKIETDEQGTPTRVDIVRSSGSASIDHAIRLAMFSSFFGGKMPDTFPFGITLWQ